MAATIGNARSHLLGRWAISEGISDPNKTEIAIRQSIMQEIRQKLGSRLGSFRPHSRGKRRRRKRWRDAGERVEEALVNGCEEREAD